MNRLAVIGSTGSIGRSTLAVAEAHPDRLRIVALAAGENASLLADQVARFGRHTDMKRAAQPEELSPAYVFLASPVCAGYITGTVVTIDGGIAARGSVI